MKSNTILILITAVTIQQRTTQLNRLMKWQTGLKTILPYNLPANDTFEFQLSGTAKMTPMQTSNMVAMC